LGTSGKLSSDKLTSDINALEASDAVDSTWQTLLFIAGLYSKYFQTKLFRERLDITMASGWTGREITAADVEALASSRPQTHYAQ